MIFSYVQLYAFVVKSEKRVRNVPPHEVSPILSWMFTYPHCRDSNLIVQVGLRNPLLQLLPRWLLHARV